MLAECLVGRDFANVVLAWSRWRSVVKGTPRTVRIKQGLAYSKSRNEMNVLHAT